MMNLEIDIPHTWRSVPLLAVAWLVRQVAPYQGDKLLVWTALRMPGSEIREVFDECG